MTAATRTEAYGTVAVLSRQVSWTRLGIALGYTDTEAKRSEIRDAIEHLAWRDPAELDDVLTVAPARQVIASLFYGRPWALDRAGAVVLAADAAGRDRALIGLAGVTGERHVLLVTGYEAVHVLHDRPAAGFLGEGVAR